MTKLTKYELQQQMALVDRYMPMIAACGYGDILRDLTPFDMHAFAGHIMRDKLVDGIVNRDDRFKIFDSPSWGVYEPDYVGLLKSLGEEGRAALRARIHYEVRK